MLCLTPVSVLSVYYESMQLQEADSASNKGESFLKPAI